MIDKKVVMGDFKGIRSGMIVKDKFTGDVGLCIGTFLVPMTLGEGYNEDYDAGAVVLVKGKKMSLSVDFLEIVHEDD
jgi:hypothetical protein